MALHILAFPEETLVKIASHVANVWREDDDGSIMAHSSWDMMNFGLVCRAFKVRLSVYY